MDRNAESHFSEVPQLLDVKRSTMRIPFSHKTSFNVGQLIPFACFEVLPGDTFRISSACVIRLQTMLSPIFDNMYADIFWFFGPNRIEYDHWEELCGENKTGPWIPTVEYTTPIMKVQPVNSDPGASLTNYEYSLADYFGIPVNKNLEWNAIPFRLYHDIWDQFFRDQNVQDPLQIYRGDSDRVFGDPSNLLYNYLDERYPLPRMANRYHDYFSSALPGLQKGPPALIPLSGYFPVGAQPYIHSGENYPLVGHIQANNVTNYYDVQNKQVTGATGNALQLNTLSNDSDGNPVIPSTGSVFRVDNLWADLSKGSGIQATIDDLRNAFMIQHLLNVDAISGTRYREILRAHFSVVSPDARLQIPEYLGGRRIALNIHEVVNQAQGTNDFLGDLGAMSHTADYNEDFVHSFTEHGFVIGLVCVRYDHTYSQGLARMWSRSGRYSYYWPSFANLDGQAILNKEIYAQGIGVTNASTGKDYDDEVFGYSEAWAEYRYAQPNLATAEMRPDVSNSLAYWHLGDNYNSMPYLSYEWMQEDPDIVDRVLAVDHHTASQLFADFYVENVATRVMPLYSIPGLNGIM